jgi:polysaccharide chain length determinant protein (PEP-CTERM system associated)
MHDTHVILRRLMAGLSRRRWLAVGIAWLVCLTGWLAVLALPPMYAASAQIYVAADPVLTPLLKGISINGDSEAEYDLLRQTLLSNPNLTSLIKAIGLDTTAQGPGAQAALIHDLAQQIEVIPQTTQLFTISYESRNPKTAFNIVQGLVDIYVEHSASGDQDDIDNATTFLDQQIAYFKKQLQQDEQTRAAFLTKYTQLLPGSNGSSDLEQQSNLVVSLKGQLQDMIAKRDMLKQQLKQTAPVLSTSTSVAIRSDSDLAAAEQQLATLKQEYTASYPGVIQAEQQLAALKITGADRNLEGDSLPPIPNEIYTQLNLELLDANSAIYSLSRQIGTTITERDRLAALANSAPGLQAEYANLDRNYGTLLTEYNDLMTRREAIRIGASANINANQVQLKIINPPQVPREPNAPNKLLLLSAVLVIGLGGGAAAALLFAEWDSCFYSLSDLRAIGLPVIGGISQLRQTGQALAPTMYLAGAVAMLMFVYGGFLLSAFEMTRILE